MFKIKEDKGFFFIADIPSDKFRKGKGSREKKEQFLRTILSRNLRLLTYLLSTVD